MTATFLADAPKVSDWLAGWGAVAAAIIAFVAIIVSIWAALTSARVNYQISGSGHKASEGMLSDLAVLMAALRSVATKGALATQDPTPLPLDTELAAIRRFLTGTSGLALTLYAGKVGSSGSSDDPVAQGWRGLRLDLTQLTTAEIRSAGDNQHAGFQALTIEATISTLTKAAIKSMREEIKNLPNVLSSLTISREEDPLLGSFYKVHTERIAAEEARRNQLISKLRTLRAAGAEDDDIDCQLALVDGDTSAFKDALDRGGNPWLSLDELVARYEDHDAGDDNESGRDKDDV